MAAYVTSYYTFIEYTYAKIQNDLGIDQLNETESCTAVNESSESYKNQVAVQQKAAAWSTYYSLVVGIPAIFANVLLGASTDRFGRKFLFFLPCVGTFIRMAITVVGIYTNFRLSYHFVGYIIEGCTGQMFTMLLVCFTYVADITPEKGRNRSFGIACIEIAMGSALTIFGFTTGLFIYRYGFVYPMLSAGIMMALTLVIVCFIPESFPSEKRDASGSTISKLTTAAGLFFGRENHGQRWKYNIIICVFTLTMMSVFGRSSVEPLYLLDQPFCWSSKKIGYFAALKSLLQQTIGMGLIKAFQIFLSDISIAMLGCVAFMAGNITEGTTSTDLVMYIVPVVAASGLLTIPMCRAVLSKLTRPDQQGIIEIIKQHLAMT